MQGLLADQKTFLVDGGCNHDERQCLYIVN